MNQARRILDQDSKWEQHPNLKTVRATKAKAFAGDATHPAEPKMAWTMRDIDALKDEKLRHEMYAFIMSFPIQVCRNAGGIIFGHSDGRGGLLSIAAAYEFDPKNALSKSWIKRTMRTIGKLLVFVNVVIHMRPPAAFEGMDTVFERLEIVEGEKLTQYHGQYGPKEKHWYVETVGVDPESQGKGYGTELMEQIGKMADAEGKWCYLECTSEKNKRFFEKCGFKLVGTETVKDETDGATLDICFMTREPQSV